MPARRRAASSIILREFKLDPLLLGADRSFLESFPKQALLATGAVPLRRYGGLGLVVVRNERDAAETLARLQRESEIRLLAALPLNEYGVELFLRYWDTSRRSTPVPAIWMPDGRRSYLKRLGEMASIRGRAHPVALLTSLILTSPLNNQCPILVVRSGDYGQVLFLGGAGGLRTAIRFPSAWHDDLLERLKLEFGLNGQAQEGRGDKERGLDDLTALVLPPLDAPTLILEPRGPR
jgi:hypothetical protein